MERLTQPKPRGGSLPRPRLVPYLFLAMEAGRAVAGSARFSLADVDVVVIGRGTARAAHRTLEHGVRQLHIELPDTWMSSTHARLTCRSGACTLDDAGSRNGSLVNGVAVTSATLRDDDVLELGGTLFVYRAGQPEADGGPDLLGVAGAPLGLATVRPELARIFAELARIAPTEVAIALTGPSGSGKEVAARAIHAASGRTGAFVAVNCGAIPEHLVESELFGHRRGAFSGATTDRSGLIAAADGGTLFLDEIGDLPLPVQPALLRCLQDRAVVPVGADAPVPVDFRLMSATHRVLAARVTTGEFREDLWARLGGYAVALPALTARREDLGTLIASLLASAAPGRLVRFSDEAARALLAYRWPRNVRELERMLARALALAGDGADVTIELAHLPAELAEAPAATPAPDGDSDSVEIDDDDPRRAELVAALRAHRGNISAAARALGKPRSQIQRWMRRWNLDGDDFAR